VVKTECPRLPRNWPWLDVGGLRRLRVLQV
jgi:hypothetical protein